SGPLSMKKVCKKLDVLHPTPSTFIPTPEMKTFEMIDRPVTSTFTAHYDMVQAEVMWLKKSNDLNIDEAANVRIFNEYFGGGMSSIVFQEIREAKALAYSTYSYYAQGSKLGDNDRVMAYVGTQSDKMKDGIIAMNVLLNELPVDEKKFENGKKSLMQGLETSRILKTSILFDYDKTTKLGLNEDRLKLVTAKLQSLKMDDVVKFHSDKVKGDYTYAVLGDRSKIDTEYLKTLGEVKELTLEELFGY
ncbi:MAG: insulinase family protein, partial [Bacteroidia bacterium]